MEEVNINMLLYEAEQTAQWVSRYTFYNRYYYGEQVKANEMDKTCSSQRSGGK
jgi:hypothetical protein